MSDLSWLPSLSRINTRFRTPATGRVIFVVVFVLAGTLFIGHTHLAHSLTAAPAVGGDSPVYDSIAWELSQGRGYTVADSDPDFLRPYIDAGTAVDLGLISGPNTDRPPLYPVVLSIGNRLFGRQFWFPRVLQGILLGMTAALVAHITFQVSGPMPAMLSFLVFAVVDWRTRWSSREILTESLACFLVMLLALAVFHLLQSGRKLWSFLSGILWGLLILCRTMSVLWWPVLAIGFLSNSSNQPFSRRVKHLLLFSTSGLLVCLPWWLRTCQVLGEFRPLGTQGAEQLSAAYSDKAFTRLGMWFNLDEEGFFDSLDLQQGPVQVAIARAKLSSSAARDWIVAHPIKAALLWPLRLLQEFRPHGPGDLFVLVFALLGMGLIVRHEFGRCTLLIFLSQALAISATWSVAGRFVIPLLGPLHVCAAIGLWGSYVMLIERRSETLATLSIDSISRTSG